MKTATTHRISKVKELRIFEESNNKKKYIGAVYSHKIINIYLYCKEHNILITTKNHH